MTQIVKIDNQSSFSVLQFEGIKNLDANNAQRIKAEIKGLLSEKVKNVFIDLNSIQFIDSTGFGALISILKEVKSRGGKLVLCGISNEVKELMDLMQLLTVFETSPSIEAASAQLNP